ncbi:MAG: PAS domain-containing sensor histidine kinase [Chitinophagaceae bacterium]|nr:MAG: PAS domain-containing sensor histidine kinase [Chitinophagaceae bacterium]
MHADTSHLTSLFEHATEGIILTNGEGNIVLINPAGQRMFGYDASELIGKPIETLVPVKYQHSHADLRKSFYSCPENRVMGHGRDLHARKKDNSNLPVEVSLGFYTRDNELFVIAFVVDITMRKLMEKDVLAQQQQLEKMAIEMQQLNAELEAKVEERTQILKEALQKLEQSQAELNNALEKEKQLNEIKSSFVSLASHEFRTPLSTVLSSAALIGKYQASDDQDKRERHVKRIKDSVKHLNDILEDFLSLGKLEEGKVNAKPESVKISDVLTESVDGVTGMAKTGQQIQVSGTAIEDFITDKNLLKNILINLLSNAVKFSAENSIIHLKVMPFKESLQISVTDSGIGIAKNDQEQLFSSFFRGSNATNIQGSGLGLHIVKRYLDLLGGTIKIDSELNKGTTFTLSIPEMKI